MLPCKGQKSVIVGGQEPRNTLPPGIMNNEIKRRHNVKMFVIIDFVMELR